VQEFAVIPDTTSAPAGEVTFTVTNAGPDDVHEFVVVKTDLAPEALPTESNGSVDEAGEGIEPVDEIEDILQEADLIPNEVASNYAGKPILITQNDYPLQLYNGDVGILLPDIEATEKPDQLWAWFIGKENKLRRFAPARLPQHEAAYAMTVHKSQGSEFDRVLFILPDRGAPVLSRELIYTGLTRARSQVELWWCEEVFVEAVGRRAERNSGLRDLLSGPSAKVERPRQEQLRLFSD